MKTIYVVNVRWVSSPLNPPLIDAVLSQAGDWIRFNAETWFVATTQTATEVRLLLYKHLAAEDNWLVMPIHAPTGDGWAPAWIWQWFQTHSFPPPVASTPHVPVGLGGGIADYYQAPSLKGPKS